MKLHEWQEREKQRRAEIAAAEQERHRQAQMQDRAVSELVRQLQGAPPRRLQQLPGIGPSRSRAIRRARRGQKCFGLKDLETVVGTVRTDRILEATRNEAVA